MTLSGRASVTSYFAWGTAVWSRSLMSSQLLPRSRGSRLLMRTSVQAPSSFSPCSRNFITPLA
jgi:hypothetical protein